MPLLPTTCCPPAFCRVASCPFRPPAFFAPPLALFRLPAFACFLPFLGYYFAEANLARPQPTAERALLVGRGEATPDVAGAAAAAAPPRVMAYVAAAADGESDALVTPSYDAHQAEVLLPLLLAAMLTGRAALRRRGPSLSDALKIAVGGASG